MDAELHAFAKTIAACSTPEQLFGDLGKAPADQLARAKKRYRDFCRIAHEDKHQSNPLDKKTAHDAFTKLSRLWIEAQERIAKRIYGQRVATKPAAIKTKRTLYTIESGFMAGDYATLYRATDTDANACLIKIALKPSDNDALDREAHTLTALHVGCAKVASVRFPKVVESFVTLPPPGRRANVFLWTDGFRPLTDVVAQYPRGVDARHFVWIWNRLLTIMGMAHGQDVVHGAVLPTHVLVNPETHDLMLVDWTFSVKAGDRLRAVSDGYQSWYPPEVFAKKGASSATDIYMAGRCMAYILGGVGADEVPLSVPAPFRRFLESCAIKTQSRRPSDALDLFDEFQTVSKKVYGPRRFVKLEMVS